MPVNYVFKLRLPHNIAMKMKTKSKLLETVDNILKRSNINGSKLV